MSDYTIPCTGDVCQGDEIEFTESVFIGSPRRPKKIGERTIRARVLRESYGELKQQHSFSLEIIRCVGTKETDLPSGKKTRRMGRNIYRNGTVRRPWNDEVQRRAVLREKHTRGNAARRARRARRELDAWY